MLAISADVKIYWYNNVLRMAIAYTIKPYRPACEATASSLVAEFDEMIAPLFEAHRDLLPFAGIFLSTSFVIIYLCIHYAKKRAAARAARQERTRGGPREALRLEERRL